MFAKSAKMLHASIQAWAPGSTYTWQAVVIAQYFGRTAGWRTFPRACETGIMDSY